MDISERIKLLRKDLNKNQAEFAASLGLRQSTVGNYESGSRSVSDATILAICREWGVDEDWLRYGIGGEGPIYAKSGSFSLDEFAKQHNATDLELNILKAYFELDPDLRNELVQHFKSRLSASRSVTVQDAEASYIKKISNSAQSMGSSASNTTEGTEANAKEASNQ